MEPLTNYFVGGLFIYRLTNKNNKRKIHCVVKDITENLKRGMVMELKAKFEVEIKEHFDNEADKDFIEQFKATDEETLTAKLEKGMMDTLTCGRANEEIKVTAIDWDTDFDV